MYIFILLTATRRRQTAKPKAVMGGIAPLQRTWQQTAAARRDPMPQLWWGAGVGPVVAIGVHPPSGGSCCRNGTSTLLQTHRIVETFAKEVLSGSSFVSCVPKRLFTSLFTWSAHPGLCGPKTKPLNPFARRSPNSSFSCVHQAVMNYTDVSLLNSKWIKVQC